MYIVASLGTLGAAEVLFERGTNPVVNSESSRTRNFTASGNDESLPESNIFSIQHAGIGRRADAGRQGKGYRNDGETYTLDSRGSSDAVCKTDAPFGVRASSGLSKGLDGNRWRAIGNAVCVPVIEWIASRIVKLDKEYYPSIYSGAH
jgi:DNA (cytosine-5)-methyltransferase 1